MKSIEEVRTILRAHQSEPKNRYHVEGIAPFLAPMPAANRPPSSDLDIPETLNAPLDWEFVDHCDYPAELLDTKVDVLTRGAVYK